jgi:SAM-dependent methyltransferase
MKESPAMSTPNIKEVVREKYGQAASRVKSDAGNSCCSDRSTLETSCDPLTSNLYDSAQKDELPDRAIKASLGCGKAYGLDMTDEMLALAEENKRKSGLTNVEFLKGEIENIPLPDNHVDVIISNCVINLSGDKDRVLKEAFRVLKAGGRFAVSDVVVRGNVPAEIKKNMELWVGCVAGALRDYEYVAKLAKAGFDNIDIEATRIYNIEDVRAFLSNRGLEVSEIAKQVEGKFISAFVRATKSAMICCTPDCCS